MALGSLGELPRAGEPVQVCFVPDPRLPFKLEERVASDRDQDDFLRIARLLADEIADARLVILPGADHNVPVRAPAAFTQLLGDFLDEMSGCPVRESR